MAMTAFQDSARVEEGLGFSPLGETGEGFVLNPLCPLDISPKFQSAEFRGDSAIGISLEKEVNVLP
jgi:hypothetical protein